MNETRRWRWSFCSASPRPPRYSKMGCHTSETRRVGSSGLAAYCSSARVHCGSAGDGGSREPRGQAGSSQSRVQRAASARVRRRWPTEASKNPSPGSSAARSNPNEGRADASCPTRQDAQASATKLRRSSETLLTSKYSSPCSQSSAARRWTRRPTYRKSSFDMVLVAGLCSLAPRSPARWRR